jgi:sugar O-acyltransferase (sialic acid O-acetyltransferase NeuD family)
VKPLVLVGAGGFARETAEAVRAINEHHPSWELLGFVDDSPALAGATVDGLPVLGPLPAVASIPSASIVVCTGHPGDYFSRKQIVQRLGLPLSRYATLIHPTAVVPRSAEIGPGSVLLATAVLTTSVTVGAHVALMPGVVLTHDVVVGNFATFGAGARLAGRVCVGEGAYIGSGALVREGLSMGPWALVGMGAVVTRDVPAAEVWVGMPARRLRDVRVPADVLAGVPAA